MKKQFWGKIFSVFILVSLLSGCFFVFNLPTIDQKMLKVSQKLSFDKLKLDLGYEFLDLRITLYRQFYTRYKSKYSMGEIEYELVYVYYDNSPFGFDIGNNLFVDMNGNLSLKILSLLEVDINDDFEIEIQQPAYKTIYTKTNDTICMSSLKFIKRKNKWVDDYFLKYFIEIDNGKVRFVISDDYEYLIEPDNEGFYLKDGRLEKKLFKTDTGFYEVYGKRLKKINYELDASSVFIQEDFMIINNDDKILVEIFNKNANDLTIQQSSNQIFCYDLNYGGFQIKTTNNEIQVFENSQLLKTIKLISHTLK